MMYPRLKIARDFLTNDGIIFISIGGEEVHHLRLMCDDIFGYENFCGAFVWEKKKKPSFLDRNMGTVTDYIVSYAKDRSQSPAFTAGSVEEGKKYPFNNAGNNMAVLEFPAGSVTFNLGDRVVTAQDMSEGNIRTELLDDVCIVNGRNRDQFRLRGEVGQRPPGAEPVQDQPPVRTHHARDPLHRVEPRTHRAGAPPVPASAGMTGGSVPPSTARHAPTAPGSPPRAARRAPCADCAEHAKHA